MFQSSYIQQAALDPDLIRSFKRMKTALIVSFFAHTVVLGLLGYLLSQ